MTIEGGTTADADLAPRFGPAELLVVFASFAIVTIVMTLPLWRHPDRSLPSDLIDTLLTTWILGWDSERLLHGLRGVWDAPIFYPYPNTLAFSENLLGIAILVAPVYWTTHNPVLTYNVAFALSFVVAGVGMYLLAATLTGSRGCGAIAGVFYAFCPFRFIQISHIQLLTTGWLPVMLYALHRYFGTGRAKWLIAFAVACWLQMLSSSYVAYYMALPIAVVAIDGLRRAPARTRVALELAAAGGLLLVAVIPVAVKYAQAMAALGHVRGSAELGLGSADVRSYFVGSNSVGIWRWLRADAVVAPEKELFPGFVPIVLAGLAVFHARRSHGYRRWLSAYGIMAVCAAVLSLGPQIHAWGHLVTAHGPYDWLLRTVPGVDGMRVPARFSIVFFLGLSVMAAFGAREVLARMAPALRTSAIIACVALILAENWAVPVPVNAYSPRGRPADRAVAEWLRDRPAGAVLHLPIAPANFLDLNYQFATLFHQHPLVNGFSGYESPLQIFWRNPASPLYDGDRPAAVVRMLRSLGVRFVVVHVGDYNVTQEAHGEHRQALSLLRNSGQVVREQRFFDSYAFELEEILPAIRAEAGDRIDSRDFEVTGSEASDRVPYLVDGDPDTRWIARGDVPRSLTVNFARPCDVSALELQLAERSQTDYPRELIVDIVDDGGVSRTFYRGTPYPEFAAGFVADFRYPRISIPLPPNRARQLTIRETGLAAGRWWSVHELTLWRRRTPSSAAAR